VAQRLNNMKNISLIKIDLPQIRDSGVELWMLRLSNSESGKIGGNKYYKLKYNLAEMKKQGKTTLLTFGGAYSNHIAATALAGKLHGFKTIGVIRGDELNEKSSEVLEKAHENGMKLHFVSRAKYRERENQAFHDELKQLFGDFYLLPEGGSNELGVKGCTEITEGLPDFDFICTAVGTGATLAGIALSLKQRQQAIGFAVLGDAEFLDHAVETFVLDYRKQTTDNDSGSFSVDRSPFSENTQWTINHDYHFGRYAGANDELRKFVTDFKEKTGIELDLVYTGKMMFGVMDLIEKGNFVRGERIIAVNTLNY
jgi:1-aminocyclopropane-1-carboxylate deaminase